MSGASSNAAARRRRAAQPQNVNRLRSSQPSQPQTQVQSQQSLSNNLPSKNGKPMHPLEILKNLSDRVTALENNSSNTNNDANMNNSRILNEMINKKMMELERVKHELTNKINSTYEQTQELNNNITSKNENIDISLQKMDDKINEIKELCSKIQTFSMETNMAFMIFKNQFDNNNENKQQQPEMNILNMLNSMAQTSMFENEINDDDDNDGESSIQLESVCNEEEDVDDDNSETNINHLKLDFTESNKNLNIQEILNLELNDDDDESSVQILESNNNDDEDEEEDDEENNEENNEEN